jgi:HEAT repeat protein
MSRKSMKKNKSQPETTAHGRKAHARRFSWTLLAYPAMLLIALVLLHVVNRSIQRQFPVSSAQKPASQKSTLPSDRSGPSDPTKTATEDGSAGLHARVAGADTPGSDGQADAGADQPAGRMDPNGLATARAHQPVDPNSLEGTDKIVAILQIAAEAKDHAQLKKCLDDLVALGDAAVVARRDRVGAEGEAGLWAAEALARIGTPVAANALFDILAQTGEGLYKEDLAKRVSHITNHDSWPLLLDSMLQADDPSAVRAAGTSLSRMADTPILDEVVARYATATTEAELERLAQLVGNIRSSKATESLLSLAGDVASPPQDSLQEAAIRALANVGDAQCVNHLLQRLEATPPGEGTDIYNAITRISDPDGYAQLLYAAAGSKDVSAEHGRTAAIQALSNYPNEQTCALLERIVAQESNEKVVTAAARALEDIQRTNHAVTAKAESLLKSEEMFPITSAIK